MLLELHVVLLLSPFLMPKQEVHSLKDTCLSLSASHSWKKREVQCSMGTSGTRSGANSEWDKNLQDRPTSIIQVCCYLVQSESLFSLVWYSSICFFYVLFAAWKWEVHRHTDHFNMFQDFNMDM